MLEPPADTIPPVVNPAGYSSSSAASSATRWADDARAMTRDAFDLGLKKADVMDATPMGLARNLLDTLDDWGGRIAAGEAPETPPRPQGIERNVVITQWGWGDTFTYAHDEIATDKRDPTLYRTGRSRAWISATTAC